MTITQMMETKIASFNRSDWQKILNAMTLFIRCQQEELSKSNVGDREWTELGEYEAIANDILLYVLGGNSK